MHGSNAKLDGMDGYWVGLFRGWSCTAITHKSYHMRQPDCMWGM